MRRCTKKEMSGIQLKSTLTDHEMNKPSSIDSEIGSRRIVEGTKVDRSAAFDTVDHDILLKVLYRIASRSTIFHFRGSART